MEIIGYIASILIGLCIGLLGAGGSILTVPVLVFLFSVNPLIATGYSLFVVGLTSLVGVWSYFKQRLVDFRLGAALGIPSFVMVFLTRAYLLPAIPAILVTGDDWDLDKSEGTLLLLSVMMFFSAIRMIKRASSQQVAVQDTESKVNKVKLGLIGGFIGMLSGLVGVGGGFLMIPALTLAGNLPMKKAVGTSLAIMSVSSLIGFNSKLDYENTDWVFLLSITGIAFLGMFIGFYLSKKIQGPLLMKSFGILMLLLVIWILGGMFIF